MATAREQESSSHLFIPSHPNLPDITDCGDPAVYREERFTSQFLRLGAHAGASVPQRRTSPCHSVDGVSVGVCAIVRAGSGTSRASMDSNAQEHQVSAVTTVRSSV